MTRPDSSEYASYYESYVGQVPEGDILAVMRSESERMTALLSALSPEQADHRYEEGKWSVKEVVGHIIDTERMFGYRAHCFAREDPAPLPGFEQNAYARSSNAGSRSMRELVGTNRTSRFSTASTMRCGRAAVWRASANSRCALSPISSWATSCTTAAFSKAATSEPVVISRGSRTSTS